MLCWFNSAGTKDKFTLTKDEAAHILYTLVWHVESRLHNL